MNHESYHLRSGIYVGLYMFRNSEIDRVSLKNMEDHNRNVPRKCLQPLDISYLGAIP